MRKKIAYYKNKQKALTVGQLKKYLNRLFANDKTHVFRKFVDLDVSVIFIFARGKIMATTLRIEDKNKDLCAVSDARFDDDSRPMIGSAFLSLSADMRQTVRRRFAFNVDYHGHLRCRRALVTASSRDDAESREVYVYLRNSSDRGFLYGWTLFLVIQTGTIARSRVLQFWGVLLPSFAASDKLSDNLTSATCFSFVQQWSRL